MIERDPNPRWTAPSPDTELAYQIGAKGIEFTAEHRKQFEAFMSGHMWKVGEWTSTEYNGKTYSGYEDFQTRVLFASFAAGLEVGKSK